MSRKEVIEPIVMKAIADELSYAGTSLSDAYDVAGDPQWEITNKVHNWRNYIPESLKKCWTAMSLEGRMVLYLMANHQATNEEWE